MAPLAKLVWLRENDPDTFAAARRWVGIKELVVHELTGEWLAGPLVRVGHRAVRPARAPATTPRRWSSPGVERGQLSRAGAHHARDRETTRRHAAGGGRRRRPAGQPRRRRRAARRGRGLDRHQRRAARGGRAARDRPQGRVFCYELSDDRWVVGGAINNGGVVLDWAGDALAPDLGDHARGRAAGAGRTGARGQRRAWSCCPTCSPSARRTGARCRAAPTSA